MKEDNFDNQLNDYDKRQVNRTRTEGSSNRNNFVKPILINKSYNQGNSQPNNFRPEPNYSTTNQSQAFYEPSEPMYEEQVSYDSKEINETLRQLKERHVGPNPSQNFESERPPFIPPHDVPTITDPEHPLNHCSQSVKATEVSAILKDNEKLRIELCENVKQQTSIIEDLKNSSAKNAKLLEKEFTLKETICEMKQALQEEKTKKESALAENKALRDRLVKLELEKGELEVLVASKKEDWKVMHSRLDEMDATLNKSVAKFQDRVVKLDAESSKFSRNAIMLNDMVVRQQSDQEKGLTSIEATTKASLEGIKENLEKVNEQVDCKTMKNQMKAVETVSSETKKVMELNEKSMTRHLELSIKNEKLSAEISDKRSFVQDMHKQASEAGMAVAIVQISLGIILSFVINLLFSYTTRRY